MQKKQPIKQKSTPQALELELQHCQYKRFYTECYTLLFLKTISLGLPK